MSLALLLVSLAFADTPASAPDIAARLPLETATAEQLLTLGTLEPQDAEAIVALRTERGGLASVEALRILPGLDDDELASLRTGTTLPVELPAGTRRSFDSPEAVLAEFAGEPTIQQVQQWANEYANTNPETVEKWLRQSKAFAALPQLTLDGDYSLGYGTDYDYYTPDGLPVDSADDTPFAALNQAAVDTDYKVSVTMRWDLNELVMSSERIRVISEAQEIVKLRDKLLGEVTKTYFERRRLQVEMLLSPKSEVSAQLKDQLKLLESTANLDALTGGRFSQALGTAGAAP